VLQKNSALQQQAQPRRASATVVGSRVADAPGRRHTRWREMSSASSRCCCSRATTGSASGEGKRRHRGHRGRRWRGHRGGEEERGRIGELIRRRREAVRAGKTVDLSSLLGRNVPDLRARCRRCWPGPAASLVAGGRSCAPWSSFASALLCLDEDGRRHCRPAAPLLRQPTAPRPRAPGPPDGASSAQRAPYSACQLARGDDKDGAEEVLRRAGVTKGSGAAAAC
jgi:hypothetical protein